ncbi:MAG: DNA starvation/stationary phase protection protein [Bryobacteraceae bacterium]
MKMLNSILNDELALYLKTWNAHWNVEGPQFAALHELFAKQYGEQAALIDEIAERIRSLGARAETRLAMDDGSTASAEGLLMLLAQAHRQLSRRLREEAIPEFERAGDPGTVDLLTRALQWHDKAAWMLSASASGANAAAP